MLGLSNPQPAPDGREGPETQAPAHFRTCRRRAVRFPVPGERRRRAPSSRKVQAGSVLTTGVRPQRSSSAAPKPASARVRGPPVLPPPAHGTARSNGHVRARRPSSPMVICAHRSNGTRALIRRLLPGPSVAPADLRSTQRTASTRVRELGAVLDGEAGEIVAVSASRVLATQRPTSATISACPSAGEGERPHHPLTQIHRVRPRAHRHGRRRSKLRHPVNWLAM